MRQPSYYDCRASLEKTFDKMVVVAEDYLSVIKRKCYNPGHRIFICDNNKEDLESISEYVDLMGYEIVKGGTGQEFIDRLKANNIGMLITSMEMVKFDSMNLIQALLSSRIPVIVVTDTKKNKAKCVKLRKMGIQIIPKPFDEKDLKHAIMVNFGPPR